MKTRQTAVTPPSISRCARAVLGAILLAALAASCGGGNLPSRGDQTMVFSGQAVFAPALRLHAGPASGGHFLELLVVVEAVEGAYAVAYDLHYPDELLTFDGFREGTFLSERGRIRTRLAVFEASPGVIRVEHTREGDVGPVGKPRTPEAVQVLHFNGHASGTGSFHWSDNRVLDENGGELPDVSWAGGTVTVLGLE